MPVDNPRTSKLKVALTQQALTYDDFPEFAEAYWDECARGLYWYPTDKANFELDLEMDELAKTGKFIVYCNPELALSARGNKDKEYVAELNLSAVPRSKIKVVQGSQGAKIKVMDLKNAFLVRPPLNSQKSMRSWRYQQGLLPSSKEQLESFWETSHAVAKAQAEKEIERIRNREERGAQRDRRRGRVRARKNPSLQSGGAVRYIPAHINNPAWC